MVDSDYMEIGNTGLIPIEDGKFLDVETDEIISSDQEDSEIDEGTSPSEEDTSP